MSNLHKYDIRVFHLASATVPNPIAGNNFSLAPGASFRAQLLELQFLFTADANAADRLIQLDWTNTVQTISVAHNPGVITANEAIVCNFSIQMPELDLSAANSIMFAPLPHQLFIESTDAIISNTANIQVGDAFTNIFCRYKVWMRL